MRIDVQKQADEFFQARLSQNKKKEEESENKLIEQADIIIGYKLPSFISRNQAASIMNFLCLDANDIKQECLYLLHVSLHSYDPTKNVKFLSYYLFNVRRHILKFVVRVDSLTMQGKIHKVSIHETTTQGENMTFEDLLVCEDDMAERIEREETFERMLSHLTEKERAIVSDMVYDRPGKSKRHTYRTLSRKHKMSTASICHMIAKIIKKAKRLHERGILSV